MPTRLKIHPADLRGAARLAADATLGVTDLVEAMHERIARVPLPLPGRAAPDGRTGGISGLVYRTVRGVTRLVGGSADALLGLVAQAWPAAEPSPEREAWVAALNGVLGDHLAATGNPLAIGMALRHGGQALPPGREALAAALPHAGPTLLVLLHGLCMNDLQWTRDGHDHGAVLQRELGFTPVYAHYNSGLHVSINGRALALQLEDLVQRWPVPLTRLVLVGFSMGGLVARSALHAAREGEGAEGAEGAPGAEGAKGAGMRWPALLSDLVFLGTPHHGAPLERAGNWVDILLGAAPYAGPMARLGKVRSAGITDLRHGNLLDEDWAGHDRFARRADHRRPVPLPPGVRCHALAATTGEQPGDGKSRLLGDGLVPLASALGRHKNPLRTLAFAPENQWVGTRMNHLELLSRPEVFDELRRRLG